MNKDNKILACVDQSRFADTVADYAAWAATRMDAPLEFLHVIDRHPELGSGGDHSGTIGFDAQEQLLHTLSDKDAALSRAAREQGRIFLNRLRERAIAAGVPAPDMRQRHGALDDTLAEQEDGVRMFVFGRRGASAETNSQALGSNVERVVRALHKPALTVTEGFTEPRRVLIAFDGGIVTRHGVEMVANRPAVPRPAHSSADVGQGKPERAEAAGVGEEHARDGRLRGPCLIDSRRRGAGHRENGESTGHRPADHGRLRPLSAAQPAVWQQDHRPAAHRHHSDTAAAGLKSPAAGALRPQARAKRTCTSHGGAVYAAEVAMRSAPAAT